MGRFIVESTDRDRCMLCGVGHQLLVAKLKLKLTANKKVIPPVRYDVDDVSVEKEFQVLFRGYDDDENYPR